MQSTSMHQQHGSGTSPRLATLRILLVRHGLSEDNADSIWAGHKDSPLAPTGILQAKALGSALSSYNLSAIYSSDLKRASRTAEEILQANRSIPPPPLVQSQSLREQNFGQAEGKSWSDAEYAISSQGEDARTFRFPDGESLEEVNNRMGVSLRRYVLPRLEGLRSGQEPDEAQIVIVAHGIAIAELLRVLMQQHDSSTNSPWPDPHETYTRVRLENTGWTLLELAVPLDDKEEILDGRKKPIYVRIVQQNNTDHLRNLSPSATAGGDSNLVASILAGGIDPATEVSPFASGHSSTHKATNAYDPRHLMRELERVGNSTSMLSGTPIGASASIGSSMTSTATHSGIDGMLVPPLLPSTATTPSLSSPSLNSGTSQSHSLATIAPSPNLSILNAQGSWSDLWQSICVRILPLFNGEGLRGHVEVINENVSTHIQRTLDRSPARALDALSKDLYALCSTGIFTFHARLQLFLNDDFRLLEALTEVWTTFFTKVLSWLEACFLPLQTDPTLASLSKGEDKPHSSLQTEPIDVRKTSLAAFRDHILLPWFDRFLPLFLRIGEFDLDIVRRTRRIDVSKDQDDEDRLLYPRLMQMINIVSSTRTNEEGEVALHDLLKALRAGHESFAAASKPMQHHNGGRNRSSSSDTGYANAGYQARDRSGSSPSSFSSASRDKRNNARHGWLPASAAKHGKKAATDPVKENAILSSLRSPTLEEPSTSDHTHLGDYDKTQSPKSMGTPLPLHRQGCHPLLSVQGSGG